MLLSGNFNVPIIYKTDNFTIRKLTPADTVEDYKAVMESKDHIHNVYDGGKSVGWPQDNLTIEQDKQDLIDHEKEFDARKAFAYTVFDVDDKHCLGCLYIDPSEYENYDAEVFMWTRDDKTDELLFRTVKRWIESDWPFNNVFYPVLERLYD